MVNQGLYKGKTLAPGTSGYETLLHELGHAAGLDDAKEELGPKYPSLDDTRFTLMSYDDAEGKNRRTYGELDKRAFEILYPTSQRPATPSVVAGAGTRTQLSAAAPLDEEALAYDDSTLQADEEWDDAESLAANSTPQSVAPDNAAQSVAADSTAQSAVGLAQAQVAAFQAALLGPADPARLLAAGSAAGMAAPVVAFQGMPSGADAWRGVLALG